MPSEGVCQFFSYPWPHGASCTPALLPSVASAIQVFVLAQEILPVSFCSGQMKLESLIHYVFLYQNQQEKGIP